MHACQHADSGALGHLHTPIGIPSSSSDLPTLFFTLFESAGRKDHTTYALDFTQHYVGQF